MEVDLEAARPPRVTAVGAETLRSSRSASQSATDAASGSSTATGSPTGSTAWGSVKIVIARRASRPISTWNAPGVCALPAIGRWPSGESIGSSNRAVTYPAPSMSGNSHGAVAHAMRIEAASADGVGAGSPIRVRPAKTSAPVSPTSRMSDRGRRQPTPWDRLAAGPGRRPAPRPRRGCGPGPKPVPERRANR